MILRFCLAWAFVSPLVISGQPAPENKSTIAFDKGYPRAGAPGTIHIKGTIFLDKGWSVPSGEVTVIVFINGQCAFERTQALTGTGANLAWDHVCPGLKRGVEYLVFVEAPLDNGTTTETLISGSESVTPN